MLLIIQALLLLICFPDILHGYSVHVKRAGCSPPPHLGGTRCNCNFGIAHCSGITGLSSFAGTPAYTRLEIISSPGISPLTNNSFVGLNTEQLDLSSDSLINSAVHRFTFTPLATNLKSLILADNRFNNLPDALMGLNALEKLDVVGNPIPVTGFTGYIMQKLGKTLLEFNFGSKSALSGWPETLKHLQMLRSLEVNGGNFSILPQRAFYGFEGTLRQLTIQNTNLLSVPLAVVQIRYLDVLNFDHNVLVGDAGMNVPLVSGLLPYLRNASLKDDGIKTFPLILGKFQSLKNLNLDKNEVNFVSDISAKTLANITYLSLKHSGINRIPGALQFMTSLRILDISNNSLHGIEQNDLANLANLRTLNVSHNPILYVSPDAFHGLRSSLNVIDLRYTGITKVPLAIKDLSASNITLDLTGNKIECTCELKWLLDWKTKSHKHVDIPGTCETVEGSINKFVSTQLPQCP